MKHLVEEAIQALTELDGARLAQLLSELDVYQRKPPSRATCEAALPSHRVLQSLLQETERNLRLLQQTSPCGIFQNAIGADVYPAAWGRER
ncbi:MAG TPA: hypothetical protein VMU62_07980 [Acidobacteriaceae bacterium]|nr:hypothetical protein [Acidobacteriaceae bacterium]